MLEAAFKPFLEVIEKETGTVFQEHGAKLHMGHAKVIQVQRALPRYLFWPPSSKDLNPIEKVWRWMKDRITQMEPFPIKLEDLKRVAQYLQAPRARIGTSL